MSWCIPARRMGVEFPVRDIPMMGHFDAAAASLSVSRWTKGSVGWRIKRPLHQTLPRRIRRCELPVVESRQCGDSDFRELPMWRRPVVTTLMLMIALILALPAGAREKNVGPSGTGPRPNAVRPYVACAALQGGGVPTALRRSETAAWSFYIFTRWRRG